MMNFGKALASTCIVIDLLAAIGYLAAKDYRRAIYWTAAAVLTASVTY